MSSHAARRQAAHKALLPADDSDESYEADDAEEEESSSEEAPAQTTTRSGRRVSSGVEHKSKALKALAAAREQRARRQRDAFASSSDEEEPPARTARRARRVAPAAAPASSEEESESDEEERRWERRHSAAAERTDRKDYQYRRHVTGLKLERLSADEASDSGLSDFIVSGSAEEDEEEDEDEDAAPEKEEEAGREQRREPQRGQKGIVRRLRPAGTAAAPAPAPAAVALDDDELEDEAPGAAPAVRARRRSRVVIADEDADESDEDAPLAATLKRRAPSGRASLASEEEAPPAAAPARKRLRSVASPAPTPASQGTPSGRTQRREPNARQSRAQHALAQLIDLRGKDRSGRSLDAQLRATAAIPVPDSGGSSGGDTDSDEAAAQFCVSDEDGDGELGGESGKEDDGAVACVCGATTADADDDVGGRLLVQCANGMCRVWQHAACVGLGGSREEAEAAVFFCARCRPAAEALLADGQGAAEFAPVAGIGADVTPEEAAARAWRSVHGARDVGAALAAALSADRAPQLRALLAHSRPGALRIVLTQKNGSPLLCRAAEAGATQCVRMLARLMSPPVPPECFGTPVAAFCAALEARQPDAARALLQEVPGLQALALRAGAYEAGGTTVHAAAAGGSVDCLRLALPPGAAAALAAATAADDEGTTPLMLAATSPGDASAVTFMLDLLASGPAKEVSRVDLQGQNAGHYAASAGQADAMAVLLTACPSMLHGHDSHGSTPLHLAAAEGRGAVIRILLRKGASVTSKDHSEWIPLMYANVHADTEGVLALLEHQPEMQLSAMASRMSDARSEARVLKILRALAETPAFFAVLNAFLRSRSHLLSGSLAFLLRRPAVLDVGNKQRWFKSQLAAFLRSQPQDFSDEDEDVDDAHILWVSRAAAFHDWASWAQRRGPAVLRRPMWRHLRLLDAPASMGSGVERDTLELMAANLAADSSLLAPTAEGGRALSPAAGPLDAKRRASLVALGWLLGYCLLHERNLPLALEGPFLRALLGRRTTALADLEAVDPVFHRSLTSLLDTPGADELALTFVVEEGGQAAVELVPGGASVAVTDANKEAFVASVAEWKLSKRTADATAAVREGLTDVVPADLLRVFHEGDLGLLLGGASEVDLADWRAHTLYDGFERTEPLVGWFWRCVTAMSHEERALLLKLATGASRAPAAGFASLQGLTGPQQFTLMRIEAGTDRCPSSSTCFNTLKMPRYTSYGQLEAKLLASVRFGASGFDFA